MSVMAAWLTVVMGGAFVLAWLVLLIWALKTAIKWWMSQRAPSVSLPARVTAVTSTQEPSFQDQGLEILVFTLEFETDEGEVMRLNATPAQYESVGEGDRVVLHVRSGSVAGFDVVEDSGGSGTFTRIVRDE